MIKNIYKTWVLIVPFLGLLYSCTQRKNMDTRNKSTAKNYELVWEDNFKSKKLDTTKWNRQVEPAGRFNKEWQRYTDSEKNSYIENEQLVLEAIHTSNVHKINQYTSARLNTAGKFDFTYGKIIAKIKLPSGKAIWPAFWMLGSNIDENGGDTPWPTSGEIDILELWGTNSASVVEANVHYANASGKHTQMGAEGYHLPKGDFSKDFHEFEFEWTNEKMIWSVDGTSYHTLDITDKKYYAFHKDFFLLLNIAVGGEIAGYPDESTPLPQKMIVDYIKVYQKK
ncbi:glycoside hydrolase family 16 protein [Polaribacter sp.]|uniref:glycoside hydrolase family 16 protein n=1 Tax=Polaribacter sp. TaxID=1920175 RepID=UPI003F6AD9C9